MKNKNIQNKKIINKKIQNEKNIEKNNTTLTRILVIGQGGREHALVHAFANSSSNTRVFALPGNPGMKNQAECFLDQSIHDKEQILAICKEYQIDWVLIGPEDPLVSGLSDFLREHDIAVFGPSQSASRLEGSKVFAKRWMTEAKIPTARYDVVTDVHQTFELASKSYSPPYVLKADGLAAGKGVYICKTLEELKSSAMELFEEKKLGDAGKQAVLEQYTSGWELSLLLLTDGERYEILPPVQDHKRLYDHDEGSNTGGMGTLGPIPVSQELRIKIENQIIEPTLKLLKSKGMLYRGTLFLGLMIQPDGNPSLLEYNVRFGDPETQSILPLLEGDWSYVLSEVAHGRCPHLLWKKNTYACTVVLAAPGYPNSPKKGIPIRGQMDYCTERSYFIHAATLYNDKSKEWTTNGGRVLCAVGVGSTLSQAREAAYLQAKTVQWDGLLMRSDIGEKSAFLGTERV